MCFRDQECAVKDSKCLESSCQCPDGFYKDEICQKYASFNGECKSKEECSHIPYSGCLNGKCLCLPNYQESSGSCLGLINASCYNSTECTANAICDGTCKCPFNFYEEDHHCYKIPTDYKTSVASAKECQSLEDAHYIWGGCYKNKKLNEICSQDLQCGDSFSECSDRECKCKNKYFDHKNRCYAPIGGKCKIDKDCPTIWNSCMSGICQQSLYEKDGKKYSSKSGATVHWNPDHYFKNAAAFWNIVNKSYYSNREPRTGDVGHLAWVDNYTRDRVVAYFNSDNNSLSFLCRRKHPYIFPGIIKFPGDGLCHPNEIDLEIIIVNYEVYVDLGS